MASSDLRRFISLIDASGGLSRISAAVDPVLEIAAITDRTSKQAGGGNALFFEKPAGSCFPVVTNLFGSAIRVCQALDVADPDELTHRLNSLLEEIPVDGYGSFAPQISGLAGFRRFAPRAESEPESALLTMVPPDLGRFPFLQSWPGDGAADGHGRYITLAQVFTTAPDGASPNCGVYRVQLRGACEAAIQWKAGSGAARHAELYRREGKVMPVAIVLGGDPALQFSAAFPLPGDLDEVTFAGFMRGEPITTAPCSTVPLCVPTGVEAVIEGYVEPGATVTEGPFGNHTGFYAPAAPGALFRVTSIRHRADAVIPATVVGPPPMEDCWMTLAWERLLLAFLQKLLPAVTDIRMPFEWVFHQSAIISLENPRPGMVRSISSQLWGLPWFGASRVLLFVAAGTNPSGLSHAAWEAINMTDFPHDIIHDKTSGRLALDATGCRLKREKTVHPAGTAALVARRWKEYGLA